METLEFGRKVDRLLNLSECAGGTLTALREDLRWTPKPSLAASASSDG